MEHLISILPRIKMGNQSAKTCLSLVSTNPNQLQKILVAESYPSELPLNDQVTACLKEHPEFATEGCAYDDDRNIFPLFLAAGHCPLDQTVAICQLLVDSGADVNAVSGGWTALHAAVEREDAPLIGYLVGKGARATWLEGDIGTPALEFAANRLSRVALEALVDAGVDINAKSTKDDSIAFNIIRADPVEEGVELLRWAHGRGLDVGAPVENGQTPLHFAATNGLVDHVRFLIGVGVDIDATTTKGETPAQLAHGLYNHRQGERNVSGVPECIRLLVDVGAEDPGPLLLQQEHGLGSLERMRDQLSELRDLVEADVTDVPRRITKADNTRKLTELEQRLVTQAQEASAREAQLEARIAKLESLIDSMINLQPDQPTVESLANDYDARAKTYFPTQDQ